MIGHFAGPHGLRRCHLEPLQAHLCLQRHDPFPGHPQITLCKQHHEVIRVLLQAPVAQLDIAKLLLDHSVRMFHFRPHAGFDLLSLVQQHVLRLLEVQCLALARKYDHLLFRLAALQFLALVHALVARIDPRILFLGCSKPAACVTSLTLAAVPTTV